MNTELELKLYFTIFHKKKKCQHPSKWYLVQNWIKIFFIVNQILNKLKVYFYIWRKYLLKVSTEVRIIHQQKPKFGISLNFKKTSIWRYTKFTTIYLPFTVGILQFCHINCVLGNYFCLKVLLRLWRVITLLRSCLTNTVISFHIEHPW